MAQQDVLIAGFVSGDSLRVKRTYTDLPVGLIFTKIYLTIKKRKTDSDAQAIIQKFITNILTVAGQITDDGTDEGTIAFFFSFAPNETALLTPNDTFYYDIQGITSASEPYTFELGTIVMEQGITDAAS